MILGAKKKKKIQVVRYRLNKLLTWNKTKKDNCIGVITNAVHINSYTFALYQESRLFFFYNASTPLEVIPVG